jgi:hypothetical protein
LVGRYGEPDALFLAPVEDFGLIESAVGTKSFDLGAKSKRTVQEPQRPVLRRDVAVIT